MQGRLAVAKRTSGDAPAPARRRELCEGLAESPAETSPFCPGRVRAVCAYLQASNPRSRYRLVDRLDEDLLRRHAVYNQGFMAKLMA